MATKSFMSLCDNCDRLPQYPDTCFELHIEGYPGIYGFITEVVVKEMPWNKLWEIDRSRKFVKLLGHSVEARRSAINGTLNVARQNGTFRVLRNWTGERLPIYGPNRELVVDVERSAATLFGIVTYGVHLIVYHESSAGISVWAARRSAKKVLYPNAMGVTVAGGLPVGETPLECVIREAYEEAGLSADTVSSSIRSVGALSYVTASDSETTSGGEAGLIRAEIQYLYEMKVGAEVVPAPHDHEASDFSLYSVEDIKKTLDCGEWTPVNACVMLDFFIRHGLVTPESEVNYTKIMTRLHRPLGMQTV